MNLLPTPSIWSSGSDLWIVPDFTYSRWARRVDYYLNFVARKNSLHPNPHFDYELNRILSETELNLYLKPPSPVGQAAATLIFSGQRLPNIWTLIQPGADSPESWFRLAHSAWRNLKSPTLRLFLPRGCTHEEALRLWTELSDYDAVTIVLDPE